MKKILIVSAVVLMSFSLQAQNKNAKAEIEVDGVCMMCKDRIEKAAINTKGVKSAVWNVGTHQLSLIFDENKTSLEAIEQSVAGVGHDTENITASTEVYDALHTCCKYRDEEVINDYH